MLKIKGLKLTLNDKPVINDLNLEVKQGRIHGLLGVNGTGKTTLANLIIGISYADEGSVIFEGQDITRWTISERAIDRFDKEDVAIMHRVGFLSVSEYILLIAVSASRREPAFEACR